MPLIFALGRINYCHWLPLYYEDCIKLKTNFPILHEAFSKVDFIVHHTDPKGGGVRMDQVLQKEYNKPTKCPSKCTHFLDDLCENERLGEYSLHLKFSTTQAKEGERDIQIIKNCIASKCEIPNPAKHIHVITGVTLPDEEPDKLFNCSEKGEKHYLQYRESRMTDKT